MSTRIGQLLRKLRGDRSPSDIADELGVHRNSVTRWESGTRVPSFDTLRSLLDLLGASDDERLELLKPAGIADHDGTEEAA